MRRGINQGVGINICSPPGLSVHGIFPGKNSEVGCHFLRQGIFPTQGLNRCLLHWQTGSLPLTPPGKPIYTHQGSPIYTLLYIKQIISKDLLYSTGNDTQYFIITYMEITLKRTFIYICIYTHITESLFCTPETNTL